MENVTQHIVVDVSSNDNFIQIPTVQGDGDATRYLEIELVNNGQKITPDSSNFYYIVGNKPDGKQVWNECEITSDGYIRAEITYQMSAAVGRSTYQIMMVPSASRGELKSYPFGIFVTKAALDIDQVSSTDEWQALVDITQRAGEYASQAEQAVSDVDASVKEAEAAKDAAKVSETNAKTSEENAKTSETNAKASEEASAASEKNAATSEQNAKTSETNAKTSETNAEASATSASNSADVATTKASEASDSASAAATSETNAATSEENAKTSEANSKTSETNAENSATAAKTSEDNAKTSETNASNSATEADTSAIEAESYAHGGTGSRENEDTDNAKYWADAAHDYAAINIPSFHVDTDTMELIEEDVSDMLVFSLDDNKQLFFENLLAH